MLVTLGWMLLTGFPPAQTTFQPELRTPTHATAARVSVWTDRDDPYARGEGADVFLSVDQPSYVTVFRVDTDGRIRVLFPREPWTDTYVREERELQVTGARGGRSFLVDDDPGVGYLFALASSEPLDFHYITRGDYWDYRLIDGGRIQGDPYVRLTDLAARLAPQGDYDYDIAPYYVDRRFDYPRFVCYDCHAYASYREWDPYQTACTRYRVVIRDDPEYYPYRYGGRNAVAGRLAHPGPRFMFRDVDPRRPSVRHAEPERRTVTAPRVPALRRRDHEASPEPSVPDGLRPTSAPQSTGEPELRRRSP